MAREASIRANHKSGYGKGMAEEHDRHARAMDWAPPRKRTPAPALAVDRAIFVEGWRTGWPRAMAFDKEADKYRDSDGRLHVEDATISRAVVNEYTGAEINSVMQDEPGWKMLDPERRYAMLRDPEELKKSVDTWNGLPVLWTHEPTSAEDHPTALTIGASGTRANFVDGDDDLKNDLSIWPKYAIKAVDDGEKQELSCGYAYRADMTPGTYKGKHYDGVMRDIKGNHIAIVNRGRVGPQAAIDHAIDDEGARQRAWARVV